MILHMIYHFVPRMHLDHFNTFYALYKKCANIRSVQKERKNTKCM